MLTEYKKLPWPINLWSIIFQKDISETELPKDWNKAVEHVFKTRLDDKKAEILYDYFREGMTLQKAGNKYGITRDAVRQHICKTVEILQEPTPKIILGYGLKEGAEMLAELLADSELVNNSSVINLGLSARAYNCIKRAGIDTIGQLRKYSDRDLLKFRCMGKKTLTEIKEKLSEITQTQSPKNPKGETNMKRSALREHLIADIGAIRAESARTRIWDSDERIADYLLSKGWTLPTRYGICEHYQACFPSNEERKT